MRACERLELTREFACATLQRGARGRRLARFFAQAPQRAGVLLARQHRQTGAACSYSQVEPKPEVKVCADQSSESYEYD